MDYSRLSDSEINQLVTAIEFDCKKWDFDEKSQCYFHCGIDGEGLFVQKVLDYCNNPSESWPIIFENEICLDPRRTVKKLPWMAEGGCNQIYWCDKNPLRAAMIVYLMMQEQ